MFQIGVDRQVTVPFADHQAALFLIRTYLTPFESLSGKQRDILRMAIDRMPDEVLRYKSLNRPAVRTALNRCAGAREGR